MNVLARSKCTGMRWQHSAYVLSCCSARIGILKRVSFNRNVVQFYGFCLEESAPMLASAWHDLVAGLNTRALLPCHER